MSTFEIRVTPACWKSMTATILKSKMATSGYYRIDKKHLHIIRFGYSRNPDQNVRMSFGTGVTPNAWEQMICAISKFKLVSSVSDELRKFKCPSVFLEQVWYLETGIRCWASWTHIRDYTSVFAHFSTDRKSLDFEIPPMMAPNINFRLLGIARVPKILIFEGFCSPILELDVGRRRKNIVRESYRWRELSSGNNSLPYPNTK